MNYMVMRLLLALLPLISGGNVLAQDLGGRPPQGATQEEKRAFYQKRAAERARAAEAAPAGPNTATTQAVGAQTGTAEPVVHSHPTAGMAHGASSGASRATARPAELIASGRPAGMGMMGMRGGGAAGAFWLSDSPPSRGDAPARSGTGMMGMGTTRTGPPSKRLWLRSGADPQKSGYAQEDAQALPEMLLVRPQGALTGEVLPPPEDGKKNLAFPMPVQGYYRVYVTTRKLQGDTLSVNVAKAEVSNFSHGGDEEERAQALVVPRVLESAPMEIVREKAADEPMFFQLKSGEEQAFVVLQKGLPSKGARVRFVSHEGWSKELLTDEQGRVSFKVVRDYFPPWDDFQKRFKATYLVIADLSAAEAGVYKDQPYSNVRYQSTLAGSYYPSPDDYRSYAWGLGLTVVFVLACGVPIYFYRRRRVKKTFEEVRFHEAK